jgi:hypothetical protein
MCMSWPRGHLSSVYDFLLYVQANLCYYLKLDNDSSLTHCSRL